MLEKTFPDVHLLNIHSLEDFHTCFLFQHQQYNQQILSMHPTNILLIGLSLLAGKTLTASVSLGTLTDLQEPVSQYAWVGGADPCNFGDTSHNLTKADSNPCGVRFGLRGIGNDLHFEGCGGPL